MPVDSVDLAQLLAELDSRWLSQDQSLLASWGPGLQAAEVEEALSTLGLIAPPELVTWFGWHNGTVAWTPSSGRPRPWPFVGASTWGAPDLGASLAKYRSLTKRSAALAQEMGISAARAGWDPNWFPFSLAVDGSVAGVDCSVSGSESPIRVVSKADENPEDIDASSLTQVVRWWLDLYETGGYAWDGGAWQINDEKTAWLQPTGLV